MSANSKERIAFAFRTVISRVPESEELNLLLSDFDAYKTEFEENPQAANKLLTVGEKKHNAAMDTAELAAYTLIANTILNLDEAIMQN